MEFASGQIVRSKAGRDKGCFFVVLRSEYPYAVICDGKHRPMARPKRKKYIHLSATNTVLPQEEMQTDRAVRRALRLFCGQDDPMEKGVFQCQNRT